MRDAVGQVDVQPALDPVRRRREDDLVERLVVQGLLDGVHRVVPDRHGAFHGMSGRRFDERQGLGQDDLRLGDLVVALGVRRVPLRRGRVRDEDAELRGPAGCATADGVQQGRRRGRPVGHDQDALQIRGGHAGHRARLHLIAA